jgi:hypothetical protein
VQQKAKRETEKQRLLDANRRVYEEKVAAEEAEIAAKEKEASHFSTNSLCLYTASMLFCRCSSSLVSRWLEAVTKACVFFVSCVAK